MTEEKYKTGDKVLINGAQIAVIDSYVSGEPNLVVYTTSLAGGGTDTVYAHISNTRIEDLPGDAGVLADSVDSEKLAAAQEKQDDVNEAHRDEKSVLNVNTLPTDEEKTAQYEESVKAPEKGYFVDPDGRAVKIDDINKYK